MFRSARNINLLPSKTKETYFERLKLLRQGTYVRKTELRQESIRSERAMQHRHPTLKPSSPYAYLQMGIIAFLLLWELSSHIFPAN